MKTNESSQNISFIHIFIIIRKMGNIPLRQLPKQPSHDYQNIQRVFVRSSILAANTSYYSLIEYLFGSIKQATRISWPIIHQNKIVRTCLKMAIVKQVLSLMLIGGIKSLDQTGTIKKIESCFDSKHKMGKSKHIETFINDEIERFIKSIKNQMGDKEHAINQQGVNILKKYQKKLIDSCFDHLYLCNQKEYIREIQIQNEFLLKYKNNLDKLKMKEQIKRMILLKLTRFMNMYPLLGRSTIIKTKINSYAKDKYKITCYENDKDNQIKSDINLVYFSYPVKQDNIIVAQEVEANSSGLLDFLQKKITKQTNQQKLEHIFSIQPNIYIFNPSNDAKRQQYINRQLQLYLLSQAGSYQYQGIRHNLTKDHLLQLILNIDPDKQYFTPTTFTMDNQQLFAFFLNGSQSFRNNEQTNLLTLFYDHNSTYTPEQLKGKIVQQFQRNHKSSLHELRSQEVYEKEFNQFHQNQSEIYNYSSTDKKKTQAQQFISNIFNIFIMLHPYAYLYGITQFQKNVDDLFEQKKDQKITLIDILKLTNSLQLCLQIISYILFKIKKQREEKEKKANIDIIKELQTFIIDPAQKNCILRLQHTRPINFDLFKKSIIENEKYNKLQYEILQLMKKDIEADIKDNHGFCIQRIRKYRRFCFAILSSNLSQFDLQKCKVAYEKILQSENYQKISDQIAPFLQSIDQKCTFKKN